MRPYCAGAFLFYGHVCHHHKATCWEYYHLVTQRFNTYSYHVRVFTEQSYSLLAEDD